MKVKKGFLVVMPRVHIPGPKPHSSKKGAKKGYNRSDSRRIERRVKGDAHDI